MNKIKTAILGASGIVGQAFIRALSDHPWFEVALVTASDKSLGKSLPQAASWTLPGDPPRLFQESVIGDFSLEELRAKNIRVIFSALPSAIALQVEAELRLQGFYLFSNASAFRNEPDVPVIIPEVNAGHAELLQKQTEKYQGFVLPTSNCSTSGLVMVLKALEKFSVRRVFVNTMQSVSGAGRRGVAALEINGNVIPYIRDEEEKIARETAKILATMDQGTLKENGPRVAAVCCRVNTTFGHLETLFVECDTPAEGAEIAGALASFQGCPQARGLPSSPASPIVVFDDPDRPQPLLDSWHHKGMAVAAGRIKSSGGILSLVLLVNNLLRGAAGNCVLNAELLLKQGLIGPWREA